MFLLRGSDPRRAVASLEPSPGVPFTLRFVPPASKPHVVWLKFELDWQGMEDDYGTTAQIEVRVGGAPPSGIELRIGDTAPAVGPAGVRNTALYRVLSTSDGSGESIAATAKLAIVPAAPPGSEVVVSGKAVVAEKCRARRLLLFVVPQ
ncbi:Hypothetical protein A7982_01212 [Minicystis rosea]|nr:Hypothetical protein A7982_01212 [Minicystis rosea]